MLNKFRHQIETILEPIARKMGSEANKVSYASLLFAFVAGISFFYSYWNKILLLLSSFFIMMNGFFDAIDGEIARITKKAGIKGDFIDHAIDRFSDAFIIGGIAASRWCNSFIGITSLAIVLLISYMGTQAQAVGYKRLYGGILGRADRIAILFFAPIIQYFLDYRLNGLYFIEWVMIFFSLAGAITIIQRFHSTLKWLNRRT